MVFSLVEGCQPETALYMVAQIVTTIGPSLRSSSDQKARQQNAGSGYGDAVKVTHHTQTFMALYVLFGTLLFVNLATDLFHTLLPGIDSLLFHCVASAKGWGTLSFAQAGTHPDRH